MFDNSFTTTDRTQKANDRSPDSRLNLVALTSNGAASDFSGSMQNTEDSFLPPLSLVSGDSAWTTSPAASGADRSTQPSLSQSEQKIAMDEGRILSSEVNLLADET